MPKLAHFQPTPNIKPAVTKKPAPRSQNSNGTTNSKITQLARGTQELAALRNLSLAVGASLNLDEVIRTLHHKSGQLLDTANFALALYDEQTGALNFALIFNQGEPAKSFSVKLSNHRGLAGLVLDDQRPVLISDLRESDQTVETDCLCPEQPIRSWLGVPIRNPLSNKGGVEGVITTWSYRPNAFNAHHLKLLSAIAAQAAIAIRNARLFEASQQRALEVAVINDVAQTLTSTLDLNEVLTRMMEQIEGMLNVEAGALLLVDPPTGDLVFQTGLGEANRTGTIKPFRLPRWRGIAGKVALTSKPALLLEIEPDKPDFIAQQLQIHPRNILCAPLILRDQVIGVLQVMNKKSGHFTENDQRLLDSIASFAAIAIENARLHQNALAERDRVLEAEARVRRALARDLHDGPTQLVSGIAMRLDFCRTALKRDPSVLEQEFASMQEIGERAVHQMRTMLFELRPLVLETKGLEAALRVFLERRQKEAGQTILTLEVNTCNPNNRLSRQESQAEATIFAIVQEAVNNALKYAHAGQIAVHLEETPTALHLMIADDGKGFAVNRTLESYDERASLGLLNLRERAGLIGGKLIIKSTPGRGTEITLTAPKPGLEK
jgi:signal transduction histidine kinase